MLKNKLTVFLMLSLVFLLAACSSVQAAGTSAAPSSSSGSSSGSSSATTAQQGQAKQGQPPDMTNQPIEQKLALGTLKLEGTDKAVTADQAKTLLPLWKAVKSMSASTTASTDEMTAVYQQIQDAMTAEQVQAIKDLNLSQTDIQALMQQYGIQAPQMRAGNTSGTPVAGSTGNNASSNGAPGGDQGMGGPPPGDMGGAGGPPGVDMGGSTTGGTSSQPNAQVTPQPRTGNRGMGGGMNSMFVDPLIKILETRAGA